MHDWLHWIVTSHGAVTRKVIFFCNNAANINTDIWRVPSPAMHFFSLVRLICYKTQM